MNEPAVGRRSRGWILVAIVVLAVSSGLYLSSHARRQSSRRVGTAQTALRLAYHRIDLDRMRTTYQDRELKSPTGTPDLSMFPTVAHASLTRATFPGTSSVRAIYQVDTGWTDDRCITVDARGTERGNVVDLSDGPCA